MIGKVKSFIFKPKANELIISNWGTVEKNTVWSQKMWWAFWENKYEQ